MWSELTTFLNSEGGGVIKPVDKWKKVSFKYCQCLGCLTKTKTKKKFLNIRDYAGGTGGGPSSIHCITPSEKRVLAVLKVSAMLDQPRLTESGFKTAGLLVAIEYAFDVEDVVLEVSYSPVLQLPASTPLPPQPSSSIFTATLFSIFTTTPSWSELTTLLNSVGGGVIKPVDKWKKVWAAWKAETNKNISTSGSTPWY